jgi:hypothetical protein
MRTAFTCGVGLATAIVVAGVGRGDDWPQFRGPNGSAVAAGEQLPVEWGANKNVAWKVKVPGYGWSCPVVSGDKVFVTTAVTDKQQKPSGGFGPPGGPGGPGGFGPGGPKMGGGKAPDVVYRWEVYCLGATVG